MVGLVSAGRGPVAGFIVQMTNVHGGGEAGISEPDCEVIRAHHGPQRAFLATSADIAIYGGAAGGGKTYALLLDPLRFVGVKGFSSVIFRRTSEQVRMAQGLWETSCEIYPAVGGVGREHTLDWRWKNGGRIRFEHLQYEQTKNQYQGSQICSLIFDELTHFTESQFWYMLSRNRSTCGIKPHVRASCNPEAGHWVAKLLEWWIDQDTGYAIPERAGVKRWFVRHGEELLFAGTKAELLDKVPDGRPKTLTFFPARLADNPTLLRKDPDYQANLMALPRVERARLLDGNWKVTGDSVIDRAWIVRYSVEANGELYRAQIGGREVPVMRSDCRRFATIDTAGTSREIEEAKKGREPSWSTAIVWDYSRQLDLLFAVAVWRAQVGWNELRARIPRFLDDWQCKKAYIENAHFGQALKDEMYGHSCELVGPVLPGMLEGHRGAKLERAISSGLLNRLEDRRLFVPQAAPWVKDYLDELLSWSGLPAEQADQIDCSSYAAFVCLRARGDWGGTINIGGMKR